MRILINFIPLLFLLGCYNIPKHIGKIEKKDESALPNYCFLHYPCKDSVTEKVVFLPGIKEIRTVRDTITGVDVREVTLHDTSIITQIIHQTDKAELKLSELRLRESTENMQKQQEANDKQLKKKDSEIEKLQKKFDKQHTFLNWSVWFNIGIVLLFLSRAAIKIFLHR